jgi:hypothetical protein
MTETLYTLEGCPLCGGEPGEYHAPECDAPVKHFVKEITVDGLSYLTGCVKGTFVPVAETAKYAYTTKLVKKAVAAVIEATEYDYTNTSLIAWAKGEPLGVTIKSDPPTEEAEGWDLAPPLVNRFAKED